MKNSPLFKSIFSGIFSFLILFSIFSLVFSQDHHRSKKEAKLTTPISAAEDIDVAFTDSTGSELTNITLGDISSDAVYVTVNYDTLNFDASNIETYNVFVSSSLNDDLQMQLSETSADSGVFRSDTHVPIQIADSPTSGNSILEVERGGGLIVTIEHYRQEYSSPVSPKPINVTHTAKLSLLSDISDPDCSDTYNSMGEGGFDSAAYSGDDSSFNPNNPSSSPATYIPTDITSTDYIDPWESITDSNSLKCLSPIEQSCDWGTYDWDYLDDDETHDAYGYAQSDSAYDASHALALYMQDDFNSYCAGWNVTFVDIPIKDGAENLKLSYSFANTYNYPEDRTLNDTFLLLFNPTSDQWEIQDTSSNQDFKFDFTIRETWDPFDSGELTINYPDIANYRFNTTFDGKPDTQIIRFAFAGFDALEDYYAFHGGGESLGSLIFDFLQADVEYKADGIDIINVDGGSSEISGNVWNDANENGTLDSTEDLLSGVVVALYDSTNNPVAIGHTNTSGAYTFQNLPGGTYRVIAGAIPDYMSPSEINDSSIEVTIGEAATISDANIPFIPISLSQTPPDQDQDTEDTSSQTEDELAQSGQQMILIWISTGIAFLVAIGSYQIYTRIHNKKAKEKKS